MHVLDEGLNLPACFTERFFFTLGPVAGEGFRQHLHQWSIAGKKHAERVPVLVEFGAVDDVQPREGFPGARHPSDEADRFRVGPARLIDHPEDGVRGACEVVGAGVRVSDVPHAVVGVQPLSGFDDGRNRAVFAPVPRARVDRRFGLSVVSRVNAEEKVGRGTVAEKVDALHRFTENRLRRRRLEMLLGCNEQRKDDPPAARGVEVPQVERVVFDLSAVCRGERGFTGLELQHEYDVRGEQNRIDSSGTARDLVFEEQVPVRAGGKPFDELARSRLEVFGLRVPGGCRVRSLGGVCVRGVSGG